MRFMILVKATAESEAGKMPGVELMTAMGCIPAPKVRASASTAPRAPSSTARSPRPDFAGVATPELVAQEDALRARI